MKFFYCLVFNLYLMDFLKMEGKEERDIVFDVFDLNDLQQSLFDEMEDSQLTVKELSNRVDRNRSTVQRALQEMLDKDLVMREGKTDKTVYYVYSTLPMKKVRNLTMKALDSWHQQVREKLG